MKLAPFFQAITPFLEGRADQPQTVRKLFGDKPLPDSHRLSIYAQFCAEHRTTATGGVHRDLRAAIEAHGGERLWRALVQDYFAQHPMQHVEINENGAHLAAFLAARPDLPAWWSALADFEWWEWQTLVAPDDPLDATPDEGPLRIASTVDLRPYPFDLLAWLEEAPRPPAPEAREVLVLFWRNRKLDARRALAAPEELQLLKRVSEGLPVAPSATFDDLHAAGIVLGAR